VRSSGLRATVGGQLLARNGLGGRCRCMEEKGRTAARTVSWGGIGGALGLTPRRSSCLLAGET
jgi:hypothetical protein